MNTPKHTLLLLAVLGMCACSNKAIYYEYQTVPMDGWGADSILTFTIPVTDTAATYDVLLHVRHTDAYSYQNMWLFVSESPATMQQAAVQTDTIEFYLADDRGQWLGNGHSTREMPVLYREGVTMTDSVYTLRIQQGMREEALKGVSDIGVEVIDRTLR